MKPIGTCTEHSCFLLFPVRCGFLSVGYISEKPTECTHYSIGLSWELRPCRPSPLKQNADPRFCSAYLALMDPFVASPAGTLTGQAKLFTACSIQCETVSVNDFENVFKNIARHVQKADGCFNKPLTNMALRYII